jgi:hypothetical protein
MPNYWAKSQERLVKIDSGQLFLQDLIDGEEVQWHIGGNYRIVVNSIYFTRCMVAQVQ